MAVGSIARRWPSWRNRRWPTRWSWDRPWPRSRPAGLAPIRRGGANCVPWGRRHQPRRPRRADAALSAFLPDPDRKRRRDVAGRSVLFAIAGAVELTHALLNELPRRGRAHARCIPALPRIGLPVNEY